MGIHRHFPTPRTLVATLLLCGLALPTPPTSRLEPAPALAGPTVSVSPSSGVAGSQVTLTGSGYVPGGYAGTIRWDGADRQTFAIPDGGAFSIKFTTPSGAKTGKHTLSVCANCGDGEFEQMASVGFTVVAPVTVTPPTSAPPTTAPPTLVPRPPPLPEPPSPCVTLALGTGAEVIDFEDSEAGSPIDLAYRDEFGVRFRNSLRVVDPAVTARSGALVGKSFETEFGSSGDPIRMEFAEGVLGVGMYVGMEQAVETEGEVTARLEAFGYPDGGTEVVLLGSGTVSFPAGTTPVEHCLSYRAPEGAIITAATVDYLDSSGHSIFEPRLIDDLTLLPSTVELPADLPPVVEITSPPEGEIFTGGELLLRARIVEDRSLRSAGWRLEGGRRPGGAALLAVPAGEPGEYLVVREFIVSETLVEGAANVFIVGADDANGQRGEDRVTVYYQPPPELDIEIVGLEATQATQCLNRSDCTAVPLIAGRPTLVRAYVRAVAGGPAAGVTGELCYWKPGETTGECLHRVDPLWPVEVEAVADPVAAHRGDLYRTLNFVLPEDAVSRSGTLYIQVKVNPGHSPAECCYENNDTRPSWIRVLPEKRLDVVFIPVSLAGEAVELSERWRLTEWLLRAYPVTRVQVWQLEGGRPLRIDPVSRASLESVGGSLWDALLYQMWWVNAWHDDPVGALRYYGMVPEIASDLSGGVAGIGRAPGYESAGIAGGAPSGGGPGTIASANNPGHIAAEEIGHNHNRLHATSCNGAAHPDSRYPVADGFLDEWGTDVRQVMGCGAPGPTVVTGTGALASVGGTCNSALYDPQASHDYMSYCKFRDRAWTSRYTYEAMIGAIGSVGALPGQGALAAPAQQAEAYLIGAGLVSPDRVVLPRGLFLTDSWASAHDASGTGPYRAGLIGQAGEVLTEQSFSPVQTSNQDPGESGLFQIALPWVEGAQAVVFDYQGIEIGRVTASAHAPQVRLVSPNGGQAWGERGEKAIRWVASDADGDPLTAVVQYSPDNGVTWRAVDVDASAEKSEVDLAALTGSPQALFRVSVSDGFHMRQDESDAPISVENKPPQVYLSSPTDGDTYAYGWPVLLQGFGFDLEDGEQMNVEGTAWRSSLDGELGRGDWLLVGDLSSGLHEITMNIQDKEGEIGEASVSIVILNPDGSLPEAAPEQQSVLLVGGLSLGLGVGVLVGASMILLGAAGIYRQRRRRPR